MQLIWQLQPRMLWCIRVTPATKPSQRSLAPAVVSVPWKRYFVHQVRFYVAQYLKSQIFLEGFYNLYRTVALFFLNFFFRNFWKLFSLFSVQLCTWSFFCLFLYLDLFFLFFFNLCSWFFSVLTCVSLGRTCAVILVQTCVFFSCIVISSQGHCE